MKKKLIAVMMLLIISTLVACSANADVEKKSAVEKTDKYEVYEYVDEDGCEYIIVREYHSTGTGGAGLGLGITPKLVQANAACR